MPTCIYIMHKYTMLQTAHGVLTVVDTNAVRFNLQFTSITCESQSDRKLYLREWTRVAKNEGLIQSFHAGRLRHPPNYTAPQLKPFIYPGFLSFSWLKFSGPFSGRHQVMPFHNPDIHISLKVVITCSEAHRLQKPILMCKPCAESDSCDTNYCTNQWRAWTKFKPYYVGTQSTIMRSHR